MKILTTSLAVLALAGLATPTLAQGYYDGGYDRDGGTYYDRGTGDYYGGYGALYGPSFYGYPEYRGAEQHIRGEIWQAVRDDMIEREDAQALFAELQQIRQHQAREFQKHGWNLPYWDRQEIRNELNRLDREVDQIRQEP
ncbi:MAG: hypothetical protein JO261_09495 [Alphaproteobacteria bacterium]|nr:hypothetical protein [Alphaproteobacteria bacterium]